MTHAQKPLFVMTERLWQATILLLAAGVLVITVWCLMHGITTIFMHLYYFPIVLLAYHYRWRGFWIATVLSLFYVGLVVLFEPGTPDVVLGALYRFLVFVGIAATIAYLSEQLVRAERAGQESTHLKEQYISLAPAIILVLDHNGTITYLNDRGCRILECPADGIIGKDWVTTFIKEDDREPVRSLFTGIMRGDFDPHRMVEGDVITGTGATRYIRWYNTLLKGSDGTITGVLSYGEDITEEKAAQDSLKTLQQFQESVIANANVWISVLAPDGTIRVWNDAAEQISGYKKADVVGKNTIWKELYPTPEYRKKVTKEIQRALSSDTHLEDFETVIRCADTTTRTIVWNTRGLLDKQGIVTSYIVIGRDVTAQKAAEFRAGESSRFLGAMIDTLPVPVFFKDASGKYLGCNPPFSEYLGMTREEIVGKSVYDLSPKDLADTYAASDQQLFANPVPQRYETQVQYADGSFHDVIFYKAPFFHNDGTLGGLIGTFLDITDRKANEERINALLKEKEEQLRIINTSPAVAFLWKAEEHWPVEAVSTNITQFGYTPEDFLSGTVPFSSLIHPDDLDRVGTEVESSSSNHIDDFMQEYRIFGKNHDLFWILDYTHIRRDPSGTITHYEGIVLDITKRKRAEEALQESEHRSAMLLKAIPDMMFIITREGVYRDVRVPDEMALALPADRIIGTNIRDSGFGEESTDTILYHLGMALDTNKLQLFEYELVLPQGLRQYEARMVALSNQEVLGIIRDITERKRVELELASAYENLKEAYRLAHIGTWNWVMENDKVTWSEELYNIAGKDPSLPAPTYAEMPRIYTPASWDLLNAAVTNALNTGKPYNLELELVRADGSIRWINAFGGVKRDETGKVIALHGTLQDITGRKQSEEEIRISNVILKTQQETSPDGILIVDRSGKILSFNRRFTENWGIPQEVIDSRSDERVLSFVMDKLADPEEFLARVKYLYANRDEKSREEILLKDGRVFDRYSAPMAGNDGMYYGRVWYFRDITDRKQMETALILSEQTYRSYVDNSPVGIFVADSSGHYLDVNDAALRLLGHSREEMMSMTVLDLALPKERQEFLDQFISTQEQLKTEPSVSFELRLKKKDGSACPVILSTTRLPNDTILGFTLDISERKAAEDALRESRQLFVDIISFLPDPTFVIDRDGVVVAWNRAMEQLSGVPAAEMIGKGNYEYSLWLYGTRRPILIDLVLHPDRDAGRLNYTGIHTEGQTITAETGIRRKNGDRPVTLSLVASPLIDSQGTVTGAIESMRDISRLKEAEADLARINQNLEQMVKDRTRALQEEVAHRREAENKVQASLDYTRSVIEANPDLMVVLDKNGIILDVNTAGELLTGIKQDQLIGTAYFGYLVEDGTVQSAFAGLLEKGRIENLVRIQRIDGHITPLSVHATVIRGREGSNDQIIVAAHDITQQKQDEDAIRASLEEKVVLLREIHHRVKNNLQIIISLTNLQMRQTNDPAIKQIISETQNRVRAMSLVHEKLYRSTSLSRIDFADYTRFLATQLFSSFGTDTRRVKLDFTMEEIMVDINTAVPLGLLMNELVSNALKHAFPDGREGTIGISGATVEDRITLVVRDDGIGMPADLDWKNTASLGMRLVTSLVDQVNGTITLDTGSGTTWTVTVHKGPEDDREAKE